MSGLIFAGIGKGISDAGQTFAGYMAKDIEAKQLADREALREERLLARQEALDQLKADREETKLRKDAEIYSQAEANAQQIGDQRRFDKFKADLGQTDMPEADLKKVFDEQYNQRNTGSFEGSDRYVERYSKQKEDVLNQIRSLGGSSAAIKEGRESYKATVDAEARFDKEAADRRREDYRDRQLQQMGLYQTGMVTAAMRRADASMVGAERPRVGSDNSDRDITAAENALSLARARIEKSYRDPTMQEKMDPVALEAYTEKRNKFINNHPDVKRQSDRVARLNSGVSDTEPKPRPTSRPGENKPSPTSTPTKNYSNLWK